MTTWQNTKAVVLVSKILLALNAIQLNANGKLWGIAKCSESLGHDMYFMWRNYRQTNDRTNNKI